MKASMVAEVEEPAELLGADESSAVRVVGDEVEVEVEVAARPVLILAALLREADEVEVAIEVGDDDDGGFLAVGFAVVVCVLPAVILTTVGAGFEAVAVLSLVGQTDEVVFEVVVALGCLMSHSFCHCSHSSSAVTDGPPFSSSLVSPPLRFCLSLPRSP
jgi:hypothetical protein